MIEDRWGAAPRTRSPGDLILEADSDAEGTGDLILKIADAEVARITHAGVGEGLFGLASAYINLGADPYHLSTSNTAAENLARLEAAFDEATSSGKALYLPGAPAAYPMSPFLLPSEPIYFFGDGPNLSRFLYAQSVDYGMSYDPTAGMAADNPSAIWFLRGLGFRGGDWNGSICDAGWYLPAWDAGVNGYRRINIVAEHCTVQYFNGPGIFNAISGLGVAGIFSNVVSDHNSYQGFTLPSDFYGTCLMAHSNGYEGFYWEDHRMTHIAVAKAYNNGKLNTAGRQSGFRCDGGGMTLTSIECQDNLGPGFLAHNAINLYVNGLWVDRNWTEAAGNYSGLILEDCHDCEFLGVRGQRSQSYSDQNHTLYVDDSDGTKSYNNIVQLTQWSPTYAMDDPVDPTSDLDGTYVIVGGSSGGEYPLAFATGGFTPNPYKGLTQVVGTLTGNMTGSIAVPTYAHKGCRMRFKFTQDGTGGRTLNWAAGYKQAFNTTGNTANKVTMVDFEYDGTNWVQVGNNIWV